MRIAVIDGQGGGIGSAVVKKLKEALGETVEVWALGTNAVATSQMMKAGANRGATGENAVCRCAQRVDVIVGPIAVLMADAMMGELTPAMATAVGASPAHKFILPFTQESVTVVGVQREPLPHSVDRLISEHLLPLIQKERS